MADGLNGTVAYSSEDLVNYLLMEIVCGTPGCIQLQNRLIGCLAKINLKNAPEQK